MNSGVMSHTVKIYINTRMFPLMRCTKKLLNKNINKIIKNYLNFVSVLLYTLYWLVIKFLNPVINKHKFMLFYQFRNSLIKMSQNKRQKICLERFSY